MRLIFFLILEMFKTKANFNSLLLSSYHNFSSHSFNCTAPKSNFFICNKAFSNKTKFYHNFLNSYYKKLSLRNIFHLIFSPDLPIGNFKFTISLFRLAYTPCCRTLSTKVGTNYQKKGTLVEIKSNQFSLRNFQTTSALFFPEMSAENFSLPKVVNSTSPQAFNNHNLYINGMFVKSKSTKTFNSYNPSTGEVLITFPDANEIDVDIAVEAAHNARKSWAGMLPSERATYLHKIAALIKNDHKRLSIIESLDSGKPLRESEADISDVVASFQFNAMLAKDFEKNQEEVVGDESHDLKNRIRYEPYGVVGLITPWNYPMLMAVQKVAAALAAGCTCVLKPSEYACLTCIELAHYCDQVNLPKGVFNLVLGLGATTGAAIVQHPKVRKISFTGSDSTGKKIMKNAANQLKPLHLELGGKSPMIVFDDVDKNSVADWIMSGIFWSSGQICSATSRVMIHKNIYQDMMDILKRETSKLRLSSFDSIPPPNVGPLICQQQYDKVLSYLIEAKKENLKILIGGDLDRPSNLSGYFVKPTIYYDVPTSSKLWKEEIFGPVLCIRSFENEEEAIEEANNSDFGLSAAVMTADLKRGKRIVEALEAGVVWLNCSQPVSQMVPFGGFKHSGFGRECGKEGFREYLQIKTITSCKTDYNCHNFIL